MKKTGDDSTDSSIATILADTEWDYHPKDSGVGLLSPMSRYFRGFPWNGQQEEKAKMPVFPLGFNDDESGTDFSDL